MEPVLIATDALHDDLCAVTSFTLDMVIGHDRQDFTACFDPVDGVGGGSLIYIDGTEYGGIVDDVTTSTETGLTEYHGRTWDGILAAKRILPPDGSAYRTVSGEANSVLASLITLLDIADVFTASTDNSGITVNYQFDRFVDAYEGIYKMLKSASAKLVIRRGAGTTVLSAAAAQTITNEADSDLLDFALTKTNRTVNHLVCAGTGEGTEREILHLYADANGNVSTTQSLFGVNEITDYYDYNNADSAELLKGGTDKLKEYQTKGAVDITNIGRGSWDIGDTLQARDNKSGMVVNAPIVGKTVTVSQSTNWELSTSYEVGEVSRTAASISGTVETSHDRIYKDGKTALITEKGYVWALMPEVDTSRADNGISADTYREYAVRVANDVYASYTETRAKPDGSLSVSLVARNYGTGSSVNNGLYLTVNNDGTRQVDFSEAKPWMLALQQGANQTTTASSVITAASGVTFSSVVAARWGRLVMLNLEIKFSSAVSVPASGNITDLDVGTLKSPYQPIQEAGAWSTGDDAGAAWFFITAAGLIRLAACEGTGAARSIAANTVFHMRTVFFGKDQTY